MDFITEVTPLLSFISIVLAIISISLAIWIFFKQKKASENMHKFIEDSFQALEKASENMHKFIEASFKALVRLRNDNLRLFYDFYESATNMNGLSEYEIESLESTSEYWHFKWRFETFNTLGLQVTKKIKDNYGIRTKEKANHYIKVSILGTTKDFRNPNYDSFNIEYYICEVFENNASELFNVGERIACFFHNKSSYLSKNFTNSPKEPTEIYKFMIVGLGHGYSGGRQEKPAGKTRHHKRMKDYTIE